MPLAEKEITLKDFVLAALKTPEGSPGLLAVIRQQNPYEKFRDALIGGLVECGIDFRKDDHLNRFDEAAKKVILEGYILKDHAVLKAPEYRRAIDYAKYEDREIFSDLLRVGLTSDLSNELLSRSVANPGILWDLYSSRENEKASCSGYNFLFDTLLDPLKAQSSDDVIKLLQMARQDKRLADLALKTLVSLGEKLSERTEQSAAVVQSLLTHVENADVFYVDKKAMSPLVLLTRLDIKTLLRPGLIDALGGYVARNAEPLKSVASSYGETRFREGWNHVVGNWLADSGFKDVLEGQSFETTMHALDLVTLHQHASNVADLSQAARLFSNPALSESVLQEIYEHGVAKGHFPLADVVAVDADKSLKLRVIAAKVSPQEYEAAEQQVTRVPRRPVLDDGPSL